MRDRENRTVFDGVDWWTVLIYLFLVFFGLTAIYAASYNETHPLIYDVSQKYGTQLLWICVSFVIAILILLIEKTLVYIFSYPIYFIMVILLFLVAFVGKEINGARSWFQFGSFSIQPSEFAKFATGLAVAKYMSAYEFSLKKIKDVFSIMTIAFLPAVAIMLQPDTGSALVFAAILLVLYRYGAPKAPFVLLAVIIFLFVFSFLVETVPLIFSIFVIVLCCEALSSNNFLTMLSYLGTVVMGWLAVSLLLHFCGVEIDGVYTFLLALVATSPLAIIYVYKGGSRTAIMFITIFIFSLLFLMSVDFVFNEVMQSHQQKRILDMLGLENDVKGWGYNLNQSKIAIGSGGFFGKGFLKGTQTNLNFVPEQSTDFIFCTIGEEWGFLGSMVVVVLFAMLIMRLISMAENQQDGFGRVYCYYVAAVLFIHVVVNVGMTIGLLPIIGIPLPFFSYGGSSLMAFTILLFIAIRLDMKQDRKF